MIRTRPRSRRCAVRCGAGCRQTAAANCCSAIRYFDLVARRPGLPADVAALVGRLTDDETDVTLVNISQTKQRSFIVQGGGYGEHERVAVVNGGRTYDVHAPAFRVSLAPGCGATLTIRMRRHAYPPSLALPWDL